MSIFTNKQISYKKSMLILGVAVLITACDSFGPDAIRGTHPLYNDAIVGTMNEQFIQNIVRLHYRDPIFFLDVSNVTANLKLEVSGGFDQSTLGVGPGDTTNIVRYSLGGAYTTSPTISYAPLQGEAFVKSMLSPIPLEALFSLTGSGWSARRVFGLCVERINGIENAVNASGPTPKTAPNGSEKFTRLLELIEEVKGGQLIIPSVDAKTKQPQLQIKSSPEFSAQIQQIKNLLGLDQNLELYRINTDFTKTSSDTISIRPRSLNSIFFYLSHHVDTPAAHKAAQLVTITKDKNGTEFDWSSTPAGQLFHIRQSEEQPMDAFIALPYRDHWFYVADNDLESKSTFMLLMQLFRLQAGSAKSEGPTLTLPVR